MPEFQEMPEPPASAPEASIETPAEAPPETAEAAPEAPFETSVDLASERDPEPESWDPPESEPIDSRFVAAEQSAAGDASNWWENSGETSADFNAAASAEAPVETGEVGSDGGGSPETVSEAFNAAAAEAPLEVGDAGTAGSESGGDSVSPETVTETFNAAAAEAPEQPDAPPEANHERSDWLPPPALRGPAP
ncbi:hypothetical protein D0Z70_19985 [Sphingobium terrigena]|uniref:Uncharacterized protein n=1 Tax=Sphingobium terrigena TaxID=2304063 RepID=A0A418YMS2_9SPHN|nr:hypothetical protein [Sphingobium terrigena]RJG52490.1 hypothetical protein D0Z70_19985 [Sphingobium terrigena]